MDGNFSRTALSTTILQRQMPQFKAVDGRPLGAEENTGDIYNRCMM